MSGQRDGQMVAFAITAETLDDANVTFSTGHRYLQKIKPQCAHTISPQETIG